MDESHYLKSKTTKRVKHISPILKKAKRVLLLSGTPVTNKPVELFTQLAIICPFIAGKYQNYVNRYCDAKRFCGHFDVNGSSCLKELHWILKSLSIRRLKDDVLTDLPDKMRTQIKVELQGKDKKVLKGLFSRWTCLNRTIPMMKEASQEQIEAVFERKRIISEIYHTSADVKKEKLKQVLQDMLLDGEKTIVFAHHKVMLDALEELMPEIGMDDVEFVRIDGSTTAGAKNALVQHFQTDDRCKVAILSILACGTGLTLTSSSRILFAEMYWVTSTMLQAEDRIHRIGQKNCCDIRYIIAEGTLDPYLWKMLNKKFDIVSTIMDGNTDAILEASERNIDLTPDEEINTLFEEEMATKKKRKRKKEK